MNALLLHARRRRAFYRPDLPSQRFTPDHKGILAQLAAETRLSQQQALAALLAIAGWYVALGLLSPWSPTWSAPNMADVARRPQLGPPHRWTNPLTHPGRFTGIRSWGFTKRNDLLHGRLAMLGFAAAVAGELLGGAGPMAQVAWWLGVPANERFYQLASNGFLLFALSATGLALALGNIGKLAHHGGANGSNRSGQELPGQQQQADSGGAAEMDLY